MSLVFFQRGFVLLSVHGVLVIVIKEFFFYRVCFFFLEGLIFCFKTFFLGDDFFKWV